MEVKTFFDEIPRKFKVGLKNQITISDFGKIHLDEDEMISFKNNNGKEYDVVAKKWGFYATPSVNEKLKKQGFKTALVKNENSKYYIMIVDTTKLVDFNNYLEEEKNYIVKWLDEYE